MGSSGGTDPRANRRCASDCMAEKQRGIVSSEEEEEEEEEKPKQMQGLRGYWSSSSSRGGKHSGR